MFRTAIHPGKSHKSINLKDKIYLIGSCFSENIGEKLISGKFDAISNPFGTIYNPVSIFKLLADSFTGQSDPEKGLIRNQGVYRHFDFHSDISALTGKEFDKKRDEGYAVSRKYLEQGQWLIITLGTAIVYRHRELNEIVANCHKLPADYFEKEFLTVEIIKSRFGTFLNLFRKYNTEAGIILTVSPVRHVKDTLELNSLSKSILRVACGKIVTENPSIHYFPSYEIMMDDLRDYRFYGKDMVHPNEMGIDYIWEHFRDVYFDVETKTILKEWDKISRALAHRPFYPGSKEHIDFLKKTREQLLELNTKINTEKEIKEIDKRLRDA